MPLPPQSTRRVANISDIIQEDVRPQTSPGRKRNVASVADILPFEPRKSTESSAPEPAPVYPPPPARLQSLGDAFDRQLNPTIQGPKGLSAFDYKANYAPTKQQLNDEVQNLRRVGEEMSAMNRKFTGGIAQAVTGVNPNVGTGFGARPTQVNNPRLKGLSDALEAGMEFTAPAAMAAFVINPVGTFTVLARAYGTAKAVELVGESVGADHEFTRFAANMAALANASPKTSMGLESAVRQTASKISSATGLHVPPKTRAAMDVLGLSRDAARDPTNVRSAFRAKAQEAHPDRGGTAEQFQQVKQAYDYMRDNPLPEYGRLRKWWQANVTAIDPITGYPTEPVVTPRSQPRPAAATNTSGRALSAGPEAPRTASVADIVPSTEVAPPPAAHASIEAPTPVVARTPAVEPQPAAERPIPVPARPESQPKPVAPQSSTEAVTVASAAEAQPGGYYRIDPRELKVDMQRFQFKGGANKEGVTAEAKIEGPWNENVAGVIQAWKDPETGELFVVEGHHRRARAVEPDGPRQVLVRVLPDMTPAEARVQGALSNIANDKGTATDAAKVLRGRQLSREDLRDLGIGTKLAKDGAALATLSDPVFFKVAGGELEEPIGVEIGKAGLSPEAQASLVTLLEKQAAKGRELSPGVVRRLIEDVKASSDVTADSEQGNIFADILGEDRKQNTAIEKAELREWLSAQLAKDKRLFGYVAKGSRAEDLARGGNVINKQESEKIASQAAKMAAVFDTLSNRTGPISTALNDAAGRIIKGEDANAVRKGLLEAVRSAVEAEFKSAGGDSGVGRADQQGSGEGRVSRPESGRTHSPKAKSDNLSALPAPKTPKRGALTVDYLESISTDEEMGVTFDDDEGVSTFPDGSHAVVCTNCAEQIIARVGRGEVYGWEEGTNPTSVVAGPSQGARLDEGQGHDFAVIDDRFLVDPWAKNVEMSSPRAAFDLNDPGDLQEVRRLYGDPSKWLRWVESESEWISAQPGPLKPAKVHAIVDREKRTAHITDIVEDILDTGERQPRLPGDVGAVRDTEIAQPEIAEVSAAQRPPTVGSTWYVRDGVKYRGPWPKAGDKGKVIDIIERHGGKTAVIMIEGDNTPVKVSLEEFNRQFTNEAPEPPAAEAKPSTPLPDMPKNETLADRRARESRKPKQTSMFDDQERLFIAQAGAKTILDAYGAPLGPEFPERRPISEQEVIERLRDIWRIDLASGGTARMPLRNRMTRDLPKGALGVYFTKTGLIRMQAAGDLLTFAHELGHGIDIGRFSQAFRGANQKGPGRATKKNPIPLSTFQQWGPELFALGHATTPPGAPASYRVKEGVAEFFRWYFADPIAAANFAPNFHAALQAVMKESPDFARAIEDTKNLVGRFVIQPELTRARARTSIEPTGVANRVKAIAQEMEATSGWDRSTGWRLLDAARWAGNVPGLERGAIRRSMDRQITNWFDSDRSVTKAMIEIANNKGGPLRPSERADLLMKYANRSDSIAQSMLQDTGITDLAGNQLSPPLKDSLKDVWPLVTAPSGKTNLPNILHALRARAMYEDAVNKGTQVREPGMTPKQVELVLNDAKAHPDFKKIQQAAKGINTFNDAQRKWMLDHGALSVEQYNDLRSTGFYVPLQRVMDAAEDYVQSGAKKANPIRRQYGGNQDVQNPIENMVRNIVPVVRWTLENRAIGVLATQIEKTPQLAHLLVEIPEPQIAHHFNLAQLEETIRETLDKQGITVPKGTDLNALATIFMPSVFQRGDLQIISFMDGGPGGTGKRRYFQVQDDALFRWAKEAGANVTSNAMSFATHIPARIARAVRSGATDTLEFALGTNIWRDTIDSLFMGRHGQIPVWDTVRGAIDIARRGEAYRKMLGPGGGKFGTLSKSDRPNVDQWVRQQLRPPVTKSLATAGRMVNPFHWISEINHYLELATRVGTMRLAMQNQGNLRRVGVLGIAQRLRDAVTGVQPQKPAGWTDEDVFLAAAQEAQDVSLPFREGGLYAKRVNRYMPFFNAMLLGARQAGRRAKEDPTGTLLSMGSLMALALYLWNQNKDDPTYRRQPSRAKYTHLWWKTPSGEYITIPLPAGPHGTLIGMGQAFFDDMYAKSDKETKQRLTDFAKEQSWALTDAMPVIGQLVTEVATNYDFYNDRPIVSPYDTRKQPDLQTRPWTSDTAKVLGNLFNVSPAMVDQVGRKLQSNRWRLVTKWTDPLAHEALEKIAKREIPDKPSDEWYRGRIGTTLGLSRLIKPDTTTGSAQPIQVFYDRFNEMEGDIQSLRGYAKGEGTTPPKEFLKSMLEKYSETDIQILRLTKKKMDDLTTLMEGAMSSKTLTPDQKRQAVDRINNEKAELAELALQGLRLRKKE